MQKKWLKEGYRIDNANHYQGFIQDFFVGGRGKCEHRPVVLSQMLLCVVEMRSSFIKCINEKTKRLSSERMMLYITKS